MAVKRADSSEWQTGHEPLERHLLGTMFDTSRWLQRELSTGTLVRLRVEELANGLVFVHEALRKRGDGQWNRWADAEGEQRAQDLRLDQCVPLGSGELND